MKYTELVKIIQVGKEQEANTQEEIWSIIDFLYTNKILFQCDVYLDYEKSRREGSNSNKKCFIGEVDREKDKVFISFYAPTGTIVRYWVSIFDIDNIQTVLDISNDANIGVCNAIDAAIIQDII
jgi:hypothetical protein